MNLINLIGLPSKPSYTSRSSGFFKARISLTIFSEFSSAFLGAQASDLCASAFSSKKHLDRLVLEFDLAILIFLFVICLLFCLFDLCLCSDKICSDLFGRMPIA